MKPGCLIYSLWGGIRRIYFNFKLIVILFYIYFIMIILLYHFILKLSKHLGIILAYGGLE